MARAYVKVYRQTRRDREPVLINEMSVFDSYGRRITKNWVSRFVTRNWREEKWWVSLVSKDKDCIRVIRHINNGWEYMYFHRLPRP